jgi:hypothetical protein
MQGDFLEKSFYFHDKLVENMTINSYHPGIYMYVNVHIVELI